MRRMVQASSLMSRSLVANNMLRNARLSFRIAPTRAVPNGRQKVLAFCSDTREPGHLPELRVGANNRRFDAGLSPPFVGIGKSFGVTGVSAMRRDYRPLAPTSAQ